MRKSGVDPEKVYHAIRGGLAGSTVLDAKMPMVLDGNFNRGSVSSCTSKTCRTRLTVHIRSILIPADSGGYGDHAGAQGSRNAGKRPRCNHPPLKTLAGVQVRRGRLNQNQKRYEMMDKKTKDFVKKALPCFNRFEGA